MRQDEGRIRDISGRILDPSCGTGMFLLGALGTIETARILDFAANGLYGRDTDARAICLSRLNLFLFTARSIAGSATELSPVAAALCRNLQVCDALTLGVSDANTYDLVITNPPYLSFGSRNQKSADPVWLRLLRRLYPHSAQYKIRLSSLFQELCVQLTRPGGRTVMLVPDAFLTGSFYDKLRVWLAQQCRIVSLSILPADSFAGAVAGAWCVAVYQKRGKGETVALDSESVVLWDRQSRNDTAPYTVPTALLVSRDRSRWQMVFDDCQKAVHELTAQLPPLSTLLRGHTGIRARQGQKSICSFERHSDKWRAGITSGGAVSPYQIAWSGSYLNIDPTLLYAGGFNPLIIAVPKLLLRQTGDRLTAACDRSGLYHLNNVHSFAPQRPDLDLDAMAALLNSSFLLFCYQLKSRERGRALAQIDIEMVESLAAPKDFVAHRLVQPLAALARARVAGPAPEIDRAIDRLVYEIYNVPPELIGRIEAVVRLPLPLPDARTVAKLLEFIGHHGIATLDRYFDGDDNEKPTDCKTDSFGSVLPAQS